MKLNVFKDAAENILKVITTLNGGLGSDSTIDAPLNGELTTKSYLTILDALHNAIPFNNDSMFLDLGSGQGIKWYIVAISIILIYFPVLGWK